MSWITQTFTSSIGRKFIMGLTGLLLVGFLLEHLISNYLLLKDDNGLAFNHYAHFMAHNPLIRVLEIGLFALFIGHIVQGIVLIIKNKIARPRGYIVKHKHKKVTYASQIMGPLGIIILIFLILHLANFFAKAKILEVEQGVIEWLKDGTGEYVLDADGNNIRDLSAVVYKEFKMPIYSIFYVICMIPLGIHLYHGFASAFQTFGLNHKKYTPLIDKLAVLFSVAISVGFAVIPLYIWLFKQF